MEEERIRESVVLPLLGSGKVQHRVKCPFCSVDRNKSYLKTLSVTIKDNSALYYCHHCDMSGRIALEDSYSGEKKFKLNNGYDVTKSDERVIPEVKAWAKKRGVVSDTWKKLPLAYSTVKFADETKFKSLGFVYKNEDGSNSVKWRSASEGVKKFTQYGAARSLWRINEFNGGDLIITEGEMDALAFEAAGLFATSVPNGATVHTGKNSNGSSRKYEYLWNARNKLKLADRIIIATDADEPGKSLAKEISRRVGRHRSWMVEYPGDCKDACEVISKYGSEAVRDCISNATPWPIQGLRSPIEYKHDVLELHKHGPAIGPATGLQSVDDLYLCCPGALTVITGVPGSGKTTFLNWLMVTLSKNAGYKHAVFSAETPVNLHIAQLCSIKAEKPFRGSGGMDKDELESVMEWVDSNFVFIDPSNSGVDSILDNTTSALLRSGVNCLLIDPFNFLTNEDGGEMTHDTINKLMTKLKGFAIEYGMHVWLIAHPKKMMRDGNSYPVPTGYDVSGSASFFNVADIGLTISRSDKCGESVLTNWKSRFAHMGQTGYRSMSFDRNVGIFS